jgi:hypothetical protein
VLIDTFLDDIGIARGEVGSAKRRIGLRQNVAVVYFCPTDP